MNRYIILILLNFIIGCNQFKENKTHNNFKNSSNKQISLQHKEIFNDLKINDSLLFQIGFNLCDTIQIKNIVSNDFEFYHDQAGITNTKESFIKSISELCDLPYKPIRKLKKNSLEIHLLKENGKVYGAIQNGKHKFYAKKNDKPIYLTSTADFIHLWILEDNKWKLKRVLSYNHKKN